MTEDSFADAPVSIGELKSDRTGYARDMSARDMLIAMLRDIDSGEMETPDFAVVCFARKTEGDGVFTGERIGGVQNPLEVWGLLFRCAMRLVEESEGVKMTMLEKMATAMCAKFRYGHMDECRILAAAALDALMEPSEGMLEAARNATAEAIIGDPRIPWQPSISDQFKAMIRAAREGK